MDMKTRRMIVVVGLVLLGVAMIVIGAMGSILPPVLTGVGFGLIAWWVWGKGG